jgi:predicted GNAT family N-acyltransferase
MLIEGKLLSYGSNLTEVYDIRRKVFIEELGGKEETEFDESDSYAIHAIAYQGTDPKIPVAVGRMTYDGVNCLLDRVAVIKEYRGMQYGDFIVRILLNKAFISGINKINVYTDKEHVEFYKKIGFEIEKCDISKDISKEFLLCINNGKTLSKCQKHMNI